MGQKTHPTGFRIGINKPYQSTWFANYGVYSKVLQEDYKIRQFFEKEWDTVYSKAGIAKLEIKRKVILAVIIGYVPLFLVFNYFMGLEVMNAGVETYILDIICFFLSLVAYLSSSKRFN